MFEKLPPKILVVESDEVARTTLCNTIERYWFSVVRADSIETALFEANQSNPNVIVVSSKFSSSAVLEFASKIKKMITKTEIPFILLLEENEPESDYISLSSSLVEFMHRPFTPNELMLSIKSLLKKSNPIFQDKIIKYKDLSMDLATYKVVRGNKQIHLGPTEFKIMQMLINAPRSILSREQIIEHVWGKGKDIEARTVDVHVNRIRALIKLTKDEPPMIKTVRAGGYCLNLPGEKM